MDLETELALESLLYRREPNVGTVLPSSTCHYCGGKATTEDHIVPRCELPPGSQQPYWFRSNNVVPACSPCNNKKGCWKSDCTCDHCNWAWRTALALFLPRTSCPEGSPMSYVAPVDLI